MKPFYSFCVVLILLCCAMFISTPMMAQAPANDNCPGATIVGALPYSASQDTRLATPNATDPVLLCADSGRGKTVWFKYTADTTRFITFTTVRSTPVDYDIAMGLYTGVCGSLVEIDCNDDISPGGIRQAEITHQVIAGTTYIIQIAEWKGGGPSGGVPTGGDLIFDVMVAGPPPPLYLGPKSGSVASGAVISTNSFEITPGNAPIAGFELEEQEGGENDQQVLLPTPPDVMAPLAPAGSNIKQDRGSFSIQSGASKPLVLKNFQGHTPTGAIPPDPIMAVGPNHVVTMVNSTFNIYDKNGTMLKSIPMSSWFASVKNPVGFSDPQVFYDHFAHRWVMAGGGFSAPYTFLISVSDDDNPLGTWYNWSLPAGLGDSVTGNLPDYPQVGYDDTAMYITSRDFNPVGPFKYSRCRIIGKAQLYNNVAGPVVWEDLWDLREPQHLNVALDGIRPSYIYGHPGVHFLINASPYSNGTFFTVWTIHDPMGTPTITAQNVPVVQYGSAPQPDQLGNGTLIEGGGGAIRHKAVYRDSSLWAVHSIASGPGGIYSALHYVRLNPFTSTNLEDGALALDGFWHYYPALMVDANKNLVITYNRSGLTEYIGAYLSGRRSTDPPGLSSSVPLKVGLANYVSLGNGRNRWGDYTGAGLDPVDSLAVWVNTEYAANANNWGTWVGKVKIGPVAGKFMFGEPLTFSYGSHEAGTTSDTMTAVISNFGLDSLTITSIAPPDSNFKLINPPSTPLTIPTFGTVNIKVACTPKIAGALSSTVVISGNDTINPTITMNVSGTGFIVTQAQSGTVYGSTGTTPSNGRLLTVNPTTGASSTIGLSGYDAVVSLRIRPSSHELIGLASSGATNRLVRINSGAGDAHPYKDLPSYPFLKGLTYRGDTAYFGRVNGVIYKINPTTDVVTQVAATGLQISGLDFNPQTGQLYASTCQFAGCSDLYKVNLITGTATFIGSTGSADPLLDIAFDGNGNLFGLIGTSPNTSLCMVDTVTGYATILGSLGTPDVKALAIDPSTTSINAYTFSFIGSWNLLSVPLIVPSLDKNVLFPASVSHAFSYDGMYTQEDTLAYGRGHWLKFGTISARSFIGSSIAAETISVKNHWNLIGSLSKPVPVSTIVSVPSGIVSSNYYYYHGGGYILTDSLHPGYGHWVKANANGQLIFNAAGIEQDAATVGITQRINTTFNSLVVRDGAGNTQSLYFGKETEKDLPLSRFELPPLPPDGSFDVRFGSNRMVETYPAVPAKRMEFPVAIHSGSPTVTISWQIETDQQLRYSLVSTNSEMGKTSTRVLKGSGTMTLSSNQFTGLRLRVEQFRVPTEFALRQNYPNPFNPTTSIRYELPNDAFVTLIVYDMLGKQVATLVQDAQEAGYYEVSFSANHLASGVYFYRLTAGSTTNVQKMLLVK